MKTAFTALLAAGILSISAAQSKPITWSGSILRDKKLPDVYVVFLRADIKDGFHIYGPEETPNGPIPTVLKAKATGPKGEKVALGDMIYPDPDPKNDPAFGGQIGIYETMAIFMVPVKAASLKKQPFRISFEAAYQACEGNACLPPQRDVIEFVATWDAKSKTYALKPAKAKTAGK